LKGKPEPILIGDAALSRSTYVLISRCGLHPRARNGVLTTLQFSSGVTA